MNRRRFLIAGTATLGLSSVSRAGIVGASSDSGLTSDGPGPARKSLPIHGRGVDVRRESTEQQKKLQANTQVQQSNTEAVLSGELTGSFNSEVGEISIGPPSNEIITAEVLPDGSFAATVPTGEPLDVAYIQTDGDAGPVTLNGNPDTYYIQYFVDGVQEDTDLGIVEIPEAYVFNIQLVDESGTPLDNVTLSVRSLDPDSDRWWELFTPTNTDGFYQTSNSPTGIEVNGDVEVAIFADTDDGRVPDVETTERFTVTESQNETITVDPFTVTGTLSFADGSAASNQNVSIFTTQSTSAEVRSDTDGSFSADLPPAPDNYVEGAYEIQYFRQGLLSEDDIEIDGYVDMYAGPLVDSNAGENIGEIILPEGHLTRVRVVDTDGNGIQNACVRYRHRNETLGTTASFETFTTNTGETPISGRTSLYLSGPVTIQVRPSGTDEYVDETIERDLIINQPTTEEIELQSQMKNQSPTNSRERVLQIADVNDPSELTQDDVSNTITLFNRGKSINEIEVTQNDVSNMVTLFERF